MTDFANRAIALDNRLFNFCTLRTRHEPQYYRDHPTGPPQNNEPLLSDPTPMERDATRRPRGKDTLEEEKRRRNNECYNCSKTGHYSTCCPQCKPDYDRRMYRAAEATMMENQEEEGMMGKEGPQE
jgi:hypothetical protein